MNSNQVLESFGYSTISRVDDVNHPHLKDKLIVDLIQSIEISSDHIKVSQKRNRPFTRFLDNVSGKTQQRQSLINQNLTKGLDAATHWLRKHESDFIFVNHNLEKLTNKLIETRTGVMRLNGKVDEISARLQLFETEAKYQLTQLHEYITTIDLRQQAESQIGREANRWKAGRLNHLPIHLKIITMLDNLRNGIFNVYLQHKANDTKKQQLLDDVTNELRILVANDLNIPSSDAALNQGYFSLLSEHDLPNESKNNLIYLSTWANKKLHPTTYIVRSVLADNYIDTTKFTTNHKYLRFINRALKEQLN